MAPIADPDVEAYVAVHSTPPSEVAQRVADATHEWSDYPAYMIDPVEARLLALLVAVTGARRILELGTFSGYSAINMAEAMPPDGHLTTLELDEVHARRAVEAFEAAGLGERITLLRGPALDSLRGLSGPFDLAFIDADKPAYPAYFDAVVPLMRPGGLIVADNVLRDGRVLDEGSAEPGIIAIQAFNQQAVSDPRVEAVILTVRDGISLIRVR